MARQIVLTTRILGTPVGRMAGTREDATGGFDAQISQVNETLRHSDRTRRIEELRDESHWLLEVNQVYPPFPGL